MGSSVILDKTEVMIKTMVAGGGEKDDFSSLFLLLSSISVFDIVQDKYGDDGDDYGDKVGIVQYYHVVYEDKNDK